VSLQADAEGKLSRLILRQKEIAMGIVSLLGLQGEMDMAVAAYDVLLGDLEAGIAGREGVYAQELAELLCAGLAVNLDGGHTVPTEGWAYLTGKRHVKMQR
jgi:hypothetical protein